MRIRAFLAAAIVVFLGHSALAADRTAGWPEITADSRPWTWWWWHGSAVDESNLVRELRLFHDAGLGGVQITAIYGVKGAEARDIRYLSPEWMRMLNLVVTHARQLDMGVDMSLGTGWCFGGPTVTREDANASVVVKTFSASGGVKPAEKVSAQSTQALVAFSEDGQGVDLTGRISAEGVIDWTPASGNWTCYAVSQRPSGQKVKRAAPGGEGWMLNPLYPQAVRDWLRWFDGALADYSGAKPEAVFQDSYEYRTDWSPDFFTEFEKRRGYKLQTELPALFGAAEQDRAARVKYDYRRTVSEIMAEESEPAWIAWAHSNGMQTIYQAHGTPGNWLDLYGDADIPETEVFHSDRNMLVSKFASSAAHTQGRPFTGSETGTWLKEHFTVQLSDLKSLVDELFLSGINHVYYHGCCYSPAGAAWPGWLFYASTEMNPRNSIWHDVPALNRYIARCQSVLQAGQPDDDILLYWPVADLWSNPHGRLVSMTVNAKNWFTPQPIAAAARRLWQSGYAFDYISDAQLRGASVINGKIHTPGGVYEMVVVPACRYIPLETFQRLGALARGGGKVLFEDKMPDDVAGWRDFKERRAQLQALESSFPRPAASLAGIPRETMADSGLLFMRRYDPNGWWYFIVNHSSSNFDGSITLGRRAKTIEILDPLTGESGVAGKENSVRLRLAAGQSVVLRAWKEEFPSLAPWKDWRVNGLPVEITGAWRVKFIEGGPKLPAPFVTTRLASWTTFPDPATQSFAGTAEYSISFNCPFSGDGRLDLGDVRQSARVKLNGKEYGTLFSAPFSVVVNNLKTTGNHLEIEVTNLSANRIRDLDRRGVKWRIFKDANVVNMNYEPFDAADWPLTDSGLLGPVMLTRVVDMARPH